MQVVCINDKNKPDIIPQEEWIEEGNVYTVVSIRKMGLQHETLGYELEEVALTERSAPFEFYDAERFAILFDVSLRQVLQEEEEEEFIEPADFDLI